MRGTLLNFQPQPENAGVFAGFFGSQYFVADHSLVDEDVGVPRDHTSYQY